MFRACFAMPDKNSRFRFDVKYVGCLSCLAYCAVLNQLSAVSTELLSQASHSIREVTAMMLAPADPKAPMKAVILGITEPYVLDFLNYLLASLTAVSAFNFVGHILGCIPL